ncbi:Josephin-domain-containing protein [Geranomyces variabilis]|nr:Josephin-domain-containing protein [Geranomyces variabilis]
MDLVSAIFFEKGPYFTAVDLAEIARQLDVQEQSAMAEGNVGGVETEEYQRFLKDGSSNYDDSGFFSVQVISAALRVWNLDITAFGAEENAITRSDPATSETAFICNLQEHWFTLRRFGGSSKRWYNLNSMFQEPAYVSETYLALLLAQLQTEGYSIFVVNGTLPQCDADAYAAVSPWPDPSSIPKAKSGKSTEPAAGFGGPSNLLSIEGKGAGNREGDDDLERAIAMSLGESNSSAAPASNGLTPANDELKQAFAASLEESGSDSKSLSAALAASLQEDEDRELQRAMEMSMKDGTAGTSAKRPVEATSEPSPEEIRRRRLERFG